MKYSQPRSKNSSSSCPTEAGTTMDLQTPSLLSAAGQPRGAVLTKAVSNPPLLPCDKSANLTWPFARCFVKRRMPWNLGCWEETKIVYWEDKPLGGTRRNVHEVVSLKLAGSFQAGFPQPSPPHLSSSFISLSSLSSPSLDLLANYKTCT